MSQWPKRRRGRPRHPDVLTPAEWDVLTHVRERCSNEQIARRRGVSVNTVRSQVASILAKLEQPDRRALMQWEGLMAARDTANVVMRCSFCGKTDARVEHLIAGPRGIYICGGCVDACNRIITEARAAAG